MPVGEVSKTSTDSSSSWKTAQRLRATLTGGVGGAVAAAVGAGCGLILAVVGQAVAPFAGLIVGFILAMLVLVGVVIVGGVGTTIGQAGYRLGLYGEQLEGPASQGAGLGGWGGVLAGLVYLTTRVKWEANTTVLEYPMELLLYCTIAGAALGLTIALFSKESKRSAAQREQSE